MRNIKQKLRKISAWALAAALLGSSFDGSLPAEAAAAGENNNSAAILSFAEISDEIRAQTLEVGAQQSEIILPEELEVTVELLDAGNSGGETETDTGATEPETEPETQPKTEPETAPEQTEPQSDGQPTNQTPDETGGEEQTDTGVTMTETQESAQDNTTEEVPPETAPEQAKTQEESQEPTASAQSQPDSVTETEAVVQQTEAAQTQMETAAVQQTEAAQTQPETAAVLQAAPPAETEAPTEKQTEGGGLTSLLDRMFPAMTVHAAETQGVEGQTENVTLTGITWEINAEKSSAAEFSSDESAVGNRYVYTPVLPETVTLETSGGTTEYDLELEEGAELPEITVTIVEKTVSDPVARVEKNGETEEFDDIKKAFESVGTGETAVITLLDDVELGGSGYDSGYIRVTGTVTLEGGAYTISGSHMSYPVMGMIDVRPEAKLIVNGGNYKNISSRKQGTVVIYVGSGGTLVFNAGTVTAESGYVGNSVGVYGIFVNQNGSAEINGGTISGLAPDGEGAGVWTGNGSLTVTGGVISGSLKGAEIAYNLTDTSANISGGTFSGQYGLYVRLGGGTLTGGTFTGSLSAVFCDSEQTETNAGDLLGDGFVYYPGGTAEGTPAVGFDSTDDALPAGTYTVGKCSSHSFGEWASCGDSGHSRVCAYCGTEMTEEHAYADGICTACGAYEPAVWKEEDGRYEIGNAGQLFWFAELVNGSGGQEADPGASAVLTADIDLGDRPWMPIGNLGAGFAGVFDGGGHTVSGLSVSSNSNYQGLFGYFCGTVRNLHVTGTVAGSEYVGGIVGFAFDSTIENCSFSGTVTGSSDVGGILGYNTRGTVAGCSFSGEVSGSVDVGGIAGRASGGTVITGCANGGYVNGGGYGCYHAGGVVGVLQSSTVTNCSNTGKVRGGTDVGGIAGMSSSGSIKSCCSTGEISGNTAAGIAGYSNGSVTVCYYLDTSAGTGIATDQSSGIAVSLTAEEFASGMAAWLLNGGSIAEDGTVTEPEGDVWKQEIGTDSLPVFSGATVYCYERCSGEAGWTNDPGLKKEAHQISEENYCCTLCGAQMAARVTADEETAVYYTSIEKAWEAVQGKTAVITLLANVEVNATLTVTSGSNITLKSETDGNGGAYTISGNVLNEDSGMINVAAGGTFTLESGNISNGSGGTNAIAVSGGKFIMNGGSAAAQADGHSGICVYSGGTAEINGGSASGYNGLAIVNGGSGTVSGGTFTGTFEVSNNSAAILLRNVGSTTLKSILKPGMAYYSGKDVLAENLITDLTGTRLYGTVTLGVCAHSCDTWTDKNDGKTHSGVCEICNAEMSENHTWDENGKCTADGCDAQETIVASVTANGETTYYTDIDEAWAAANAADSAEIMLLTSVTRQSALRVEAGSDITLAMQEGVVLSAEKANYVIRVSISGSFTMKSGSIVTSGRYGIWGAGNVTIEGGSIAANGADSYEGIDATGSVTLKGGSVSCTRVGIYIRDANVTIEDAVISGGTYGVELFSGSFSINGGEISGGNAGVYVEYEGTAYLNGGTIDSPENGVNIRSLGTVEINGSTINGKTGVNNEGRLSVLSGTITGTEIGLSARTGKTQLSGGTFTGGSSSISCKDNAAVAGLLAEYHDCYVGKDDEAVRIEDTVLNGTELSAADGYGTVTVARNLEYVALVETGGSETMYSTGEEYETVLEAFNAAWSAAAAAGENATVTLLQSINIGTGSLEVPAGSSITLKMADDIALSGSNNENTGGVIKITGGSFVLAGGTVRNTITNGWKRGFVIYVEAGSLSVEGGEVVGNYAIYLPEGVGEDASVQISSGLIAGHAHGIEMHGGQVSVEGDAEIKAAGSSVASGVLLQGGKLAVNGGLVSGDRNGIWNAGGNVTVSEGTVTGGYGIYMAYGETEILGGTIRGEYHGVFAEHGTKEAVKLTIRGGEFYGAKSGIYLYERSTVADVQICIYDGTFHGEYGIYAGTENKRVPGLFGGTFTGSVCSVYLEDGTVAGDLPAEGYSLYAVAEDGVQTLIPEEAVTGSSLSAADGYGTVTVKKSNEEVISVQVSWDALEYTYTDGAWNPDAHAYEEGEWTADNGGNSITVTNTGNVDTTVSYLYSRSVEPVSGSFADGDGNPIDSSVALAQGEERKAYLTLTGRPSSDFTAGTLGTVTVTIGGEE